jgi:hypothetical protein
VETKRDDGGKPAVRVSRKEGRARDPVSNPPSRVYS